MRSAATQKLLGVTLLLFTLPFFGFSQYYNDVSSNLPTVDASFQTKDVATADIDNDGDMDIILANEFQSNIVLLNDGSGVFSRGNFGIPEEEEHDSEAVAIADFNMDGHLDMIFVSEDDFEHEYYQNVGDSVFIEPPVFLPFTACRTILTADFNADGLLDIMLGNNGLNMMMINTGSGDFLNESFDRLPFVEELTQDLAASDFDYDGDIDIFMANEDGNKILMNNGFGIFVDEASVRLPQGLNIDSRTVLLEDVNMDGFVDIFLCNVEFGPGKDPKNRLYLNNGQGIFSDVTEDYLPPYNDQSLDAVFCDIDFDGDPDLIISNILEVPMAAYINDGNGKFTDISNLVFGAPITVEAFGLVSADFNGDGIEDLYICNLDGKDILLFRNPDVVATQNLEKLEAKIFPNPIDLTFSLEGNFSKVDWTFQLFNLEGRLIQNIQPTEVSSQRFTFNTPTSLQNGSYFLKAISNKKAGVFRLIIMR